MFKLNTVIRSNRRHTATLILTTSLAVLLVFNHCLAEDTDNIQQSSEQIDADISDTPTIEFLELKRKFDEAIFAYPDMWYTQAEPDQPTTSDNGYHQYPALFGLAKMYALTNQTSYLELGTDIALKFVDSGRDMDRDGFKDWRWGHRARPNRLNHDHYEWRSAMGVSFIASALHKQLDIDTPPSPSLERLTHYLEHDVWTKWTPKKAPKKRSNNATLGTNFVARLGTIAINLHTITGDEKYLEYLNSKGAQMVEGMLETISPSTNTIDFRWRIDGTGGPTYAKFPSMDSSHAQDVVIFLTHAFENGYDFNGSLTAEFMNKLTNTAKDVVFAGSDLTYLVNGNGPKRGVHRAPVAYVTQQVAGWSALAPYDDALAQKFIERARTHRSITNSRGSYVSFERRLMLFANLADAVK